MKSRRLLTGAATAVVLALGTVSAPPSQAAAGDRHGGRPADGAAVRAWNEIAVNTFTGLPGPAGGTPFGAQIHTAMVQGAVFDAVNAIGRKHFRSYLLRQRFPWWASKDAAVATAAYRVIREIVATVPNLLDADRTSRLDTLRTQYTDALADVPDGWAEWMGILAGRAAARAMLAARAGDGRFGPSPWVPSTAVGHWYPQTDPATGQLVLDPTPWIGGVDPFALASPSQFRTPGPLPLTSAAYARELNEVKAIGRVDSTVRTPEQTYVALWWQSAPVRSWNEVGRDLAMRADLGPVRTARLLALQNLSGADASINCWNDKYHWDFWRPWNAIPRAAEDGNPATTPDADWRPLIAAPYPDEPSGHLCLDGAHTRILQKFFGDRISGGYAITSVSPLLGPDDARVRRFTSFSQALAEVVEARIWAGLHFRTADVHGKVLGQDVARYVVRHVLRPVGHGHSHHH